MRGGCGVLRITHCSDRGWQPGALCQTHPDACLCVAGEPRAGFTFLMVEKEEYLVTHENYMKFNFQYP